jgi:AI-2 transport protein TqsA
VVALSVVVTAVFAVLALSVTASVMTLTETESSWRQRALERVREVSDWAHGFSVVGPKAEGQTPPEEVFAGRLTQQLVTQLRAVAVGLPEVFAAGLYLLFLLVESARFPDRVRRAYTPHKAREILTVFAQINATIINYLRAKVVSILLLAVPVGVTLVAFGVPFATLWTVLTFVCNFIPYLGSVIAYTLPVAFAAVEFGFTTQFAVVASVVFAVHLLGAALIEPLILGRAVGLSPLVILASLSIWGILWGVPGMFLAVPLTVVVKIVFEHLPATRPVAQLLSDR